MMSDVLYEAITQIAAYQTRFPEVYADLETDIDVTIAFMRKLLRKLDRVPQDIEGQADDFTTYGGDTPLQE